MHLPPPGPPNKAERDMILNAWIALGVLGLIASVILFVVYIC